MLVIACVGLSLSIWTQLDLQRDRQLSGQTRPDSVRASVRLAGQLRQQGKYPQALQILAEIPVESLSAELRARHWLEIAKCHSDLGQSQLAQQAAAEIDLQYLRDDEAVVADFLAVELALLNKEYDRAELALQRLEQRLRSDERQTWAAVVSLRRVELWLAERKPNDAIGEAEKALRDFPDFDQRCELRYLLARATIASAQFERAREQLRVVIADPIAMRTTIAAKSQWLLGETHLLQKQYGQAIVEYSRIEGYGAVAPWDSLAELQKGKCHEHLGQRELAISCYRRVTQRFPNSDSSQHANERLKVLGQ